jgi:hypothetical protein
MAVNPDAAKLLEFKVVPPREGSCLTLELLQEIAASFRIQMPPAAAGDGACLSTDQNNIARPDGLGCILVPAARLYREEQTWDASTEEDLTFDAFEGEGYNALTCMLAIHIYPDSGETGVEVKAEPSGTAFIRPTAEIVARTADAITIAVKNALSDVRVEIELLEIPIPQQAA